MADLPDISEEPFIILKINRIRINFNKSEKLLSCWVDLNTGEIFDPLEGEVKKDGFELHVIT